MCKDEPATWPELREECGRTLKVMRVEQEPSKCRKPVPQVTMEEVAKHNSLSDLWIVVENRAYDITKWFKSHPGGYGPLLGMAGKDATDMFTNFHPNYVWEKKLPFFHCADVVGKPARTEEQKDFHELRQRLLREGKFETKLAGFYLPTLLWIFSLLSAAIYFTVACDSFQSRMVGAVFLGVYFQQMAFVGHDIGHNAVTHNRPTDLYLGQVLTSLFGVSIAWWKRSHNTHHVVTNSLEQDPDIQHLPAIALDTRAFDGFFSTYHTKVFTPLLLDPIAKVLVRSQHLLYFPLMAVARFNLYAQSLIMILSPRGEPVEKRLHQICAHTFFFCGLGYLTTRNASFYEGLAYLLVSHGISGLLHVQITISHFAMDIYSNKTDSKYVSAESSWLRTQLATTMNVDCHPMLDWLHGGLQFQIEHHLFPRVPRHNLRELRTHVKALCKKHDIPYHEYSFFESCKMVISRLKQVSAESVKLSMDGKAVGRAKAALQSLMDDALVG